MATSGFGILVGNCLELFQRSGLVNFQLNLQFTFYLEVAFICMKVCRNLSPILSFYYVDLYIPLPTVLHCKDVNKKFKTDSKVYVGCIFIFYGTYFCLLKTLGRKQKSCNYTEFSQLI